MLGKWQLQVDPNKVVLPGILYQRVEIVVQPWRIILAGIYAGYNGGEFYSLFGLGETIKTVRAEE